MPEEKQVPSSSSTMTFANLPDFAEMFERVVVPAHFVPWGRDLIERAQPIGPSTRVLDLGCGTGIVARLLRERLGAAARLTGLDVNPGMLAVARRVAPDIEWHEGNAMSLPFPDGSFELVLSQQMLQFVPDRAAAAREMRRVLVPGGRVLASTWRSVEEQPLLAALTDVATRHLGPPNDTRWSLAEADALRALMTEAGFVDVKVDVVTRTDTMTDELVRLNLMAMGFDLAALSDDERARRFAAIAAESAPILARWAGEGGYAAAMATNIVTAVAPE